MGFCVINVFFLWIGGMVGGFEMFVDFGFVGCGFVERVFGSVY